MPAEAAEAATPEAGESLSSEGLAVARRVAELHPEERPRERLARHGAAALANRELLALLIGSGSGHASALDVADGLAAHGLRGLAGASLDDLTGLPGLGRAKAMRLLAALELGARAASEGRAPLADFRSPEDSARYLLPRYATRPVETFGALLLDVRHGLLREVVISVGCLTSSLVHPRELFKEAVSARAAALILFHNHPSGDPEPSAEDLALTRRLVSAGTLMGIDVLDHLVLGAGRYVSLKQRGAL